MTEWLSTELPSEKHLEWSQAWSGPLLDIGCGGGRWLPSLSQSLRGRAVIGLDINSEQLAQAADLAKSCNVIFHPVVANADSGLPVGDASVGGVICIGLLQWMESSLDVFLAEVRRVLRHGGLGLLSVPAFGSIPDIINRLESDAMTPPFRLFGDEGIKNSIDVNGLLLQNMQTERRYVDFRSAMEFSQYLESILSLVPQLQAHPGEIAAYATEIASQRSDYVLPMVKLHATIRNC